MRWLSVPPLLYLSLVGLSSAALAAPDEHRHDEHHHSDIDHVPVDQGDLDNGHVDHGHMHHGGMDHGNQQHGNQEHGEGASDPASHHHLVGPPAGSAPVRNPASRLPPAERPPAAAFTGPRHAADAIWGAEVMTGARAQLAHEVGHGRFGQVQFDRLEWWDGGGYLADVQAWYGNDYNRLMLELELDGDQEALGEASLQIHWNRPLSPFFDWQLGLRFDFEPTSMTYLAAAVQGLAPYRVELEWGLFLSEQGDLSSEFEAEYDLYLTQRLILQPRAELTVDGAAGGARGAALGLRLRHEFAREFAPYLGFEYHADLKHGGGEGRAMAGVRAWF